jgi:hypothetical protein
VLKPLESEPVPRFFSLIFRNGDMLFNAEKFQ